MFVLRAGPREDRGAEAGGEGHPGDGHGHGAEHQLRRRKPSECRDHEPEAQVRHEPREQGAQRHTADDRARLHAEQATSSEARHGQESERQQAGRGDDVGHDRERDEQDADDGDGQRHDEQQQQRHQP
ncbi:MAG: hypothetical protein B7Z72_12875 [Gemmatimonadetes bacterium 21-71-4]|nr:MAG: hypothetical protein B7Z72_12875 [Gemmatimonadetes bacterium 21-71-4]